MLWASAPLGLAVGAFLWINEFPDARADAASGKRTLVVRLGRHRAARGFVALLAVTWLTVGLLPAAGLPATVWLGAIGLPHAIAAAQRLVRSPDVVREIVPAQAWTLLSFVLMAVGIAAGFVLAP